MLYTLFGGFLAVSLTDFVQGAIMFAALVLVPIVAFTQLGGVSPALHEITAVNPKLLDIFKGASVISIISYLAWGLGYYGQPHIIVRFMAIKHIKDLKPARRIGMSWMIISILGSTVTGLVGVAYAHKFGVAVSDPETIFIIFSKILFHPLITGFLLSAILAAIMSSISSQLLVTASAMTEDLYRTFFRREASDKELVLAGRLSVLIIAVIAILMSLNPSSTILDLVGYAWAGFGSAFGPAILLSLYWKRMTEWGALSAMVVGAATVLIWITTGLADSTGIYEMIRIFLEYDCRYYWKLDHKTSCKSLIPIIRCHGKAVKTQKVNKKPSSAAWWLLCSCFAINTVRKSYLFKNTLEKGKFAVELVY